MGMTHAAHIQASLLAGGLKASTPAVVVQNATGGAQGADTNHSFMTLGTLATTIARKGLKSPSIMVIGEVVNCGLAALEHHAVPALAWAA
jgi:siroheme synthase